MDENEKVTINWSIDNFFERVEELKRIKNYKFDLNKWSAIGKIKPSKVVTCSDPEKKPKSNARIVFPYFTSPEFVLHKENRHIFKLYFYPQGVVRGRNKEITDDVAIVLQLNSGSYKDKDINEAVMLRWKPDIIFDNQEPCFENIIVDNKWSNDIQINGQPQNKVKRQSFVNFNQLKESFFEKTLTLKIEIKIVDDTRLDLNFNNDNDKLEIEALKYFKYFKKRNLNTLFISKNSNKKIECSGNDTLIETFSIPVKSFLKLNNKKLYEISYNEVSNETVQAMLDFIESGTIHSIKNASNNKILTELAKEFRIPELILICQDWHEMNNKMDSTKLIQRYDTGKPSQNKDENQYTLPDPYAFIADLASETSIPIPGYYLPMEKLLLELQNKRQKKILTVYQSLKKLHEFQFVQELQEFKNDKEYIFSKYRIQYQWLVLNNFPFNEAKNYEKLFKIYFLEKQKRHQNVFVYFVLDPRILFKTNDFQNCLDNDEYKINHEMLATFIRSIFYIGKGQGERPFNHFRRSYLDDKEESQKKTQIKDIYSSGKEPIILITFSGISNDEAITREALLIESLMCHLTNAKREKCRMALNKHQRDLLSAYFVFKAFMMFQIDGGITVKQMANEAEVKIEEEIIIKEEFEG